MKPVLLLFVLTLCGLTSRLYAQTPKYLVANGEYQNFILNNTTQTLYGLGTGGNGIGSNTAVLGYATPCQFPAANTKIKFAAGGLHTGTAIDVNGNVYFTGANEDGSMGNGTTTGSASSFVQVTTDSLGNPFTNVTNLVMASTSFTGGQGYGAIIFAIKADGTLWVWGNTQGGYRGNGTYGMVNTRPVQITGFPAGTVITKVVVQDIVIALDSAGNVWTWAGNGSNSPLLGNTSRANYETPQILSLPGKAKDIAGGGLWSYALLTNGSLYGWGLYLGYMGVGATASAGWTNQAAPLLLDADLNLPKPIAHISCNATTTYVILTDGTMWSWGGNECGQAGAGYELNYALYTTNPAPYGGTAPAPYAWNWDMSNAQCQQHKPVQIAPGISNFVALSEGTAAVFYKFAVDANGQLYAWGRNKYGVQGNGVMDANPINGNIGSVYPNSWDVPYVTAINPFPASGAQTIQSSSPYCLGNSTTSPCNVYSLPANTPPNALINGAKSGSETVTGVTTFPLSGTASTDNVAIVYYIWTQVSGPNTPIISIPSGTTVNIMNVIPGTYKFQLKTIDNEWLSDSTTYTVTVASAGAQPPVANAGTAQTITLPTNSVTLTGSGSEVNGKIVGYQWTQLSGPSTATIGTSTQAATVVSGLIAGAYRFQLMVTDSLGVTATATVQVTVNAAIVPGSPVLSAGANQNITLPVNNTTVTATASETNGTIVSYQWTQLSGPSTATIAAPAQASTGISGLVQGVYTFQIKVTDNSGVTATDVVKVTVNPAVVVPGSLNVNAGVDQTLTLPVSSTILTATASETNGTIVSYQWTQLSGPSTATIAAAGQASTTISGLVQGVYNFQITVTDNSGTTATDAVKVTVNAAAVVPGPPSANAGPDQTITLPTSSVTLSGSGSEANGTIVSYKWTQISGPSTATIGTADQAATGVSGLVQGVYQFQLTVTDNSGVTATDVVKVTVNPAVVHVPPVAVAGPDQTVTLPVSFVSLDGSGSYETNGTIVSYEWVQLSGLGGVTIVNSSTATPDIYGLQPGTYVFQLTVTDNFGASASDQVTIVVGAAPPPVVAMPVANAGADTVIAYPSSSAVLNGSQSYSPNGNIVSYSWSQISGPSNAAIASDSGGTSMVNQLEIGVYVFQLTVTDSKGGVDTSSVTVTVINSERTTQNPFQLYPNPVVGSTVTISGINSYTGNVKVDLLGVRGEHIATYEFSKEGDQFLQNVPLPANLARGVYIVTILFQGQATPYICRMVKQ